MKSDESEDGGETETGEDGEEGEKDKEEKEKEEEEKTEPPLEDDTKKHGFLILSREDSTMVGKCLCLGISNCDILFKTLFYTAGSTSTTSLCVTVDPSDRSGDHGAGHQWFRHPGAHSVRRKHR